jgi:hypothetical protein
MFKIIQEKFKNTVNFSNDILILFLFGFTELTASIFVLLVILKIFNNIFEENYYLNYYFHKVFNLIKLKKERILLISEFLTTILILALFLISLLEVFSLLKKESLSSTNSKLFFFLENYKLIYYLIIIITLSAFIKNILRKNNYLIWVTIFCNLSLGLITIFYYQKIILSPAIYLNILLIINLIEFIILYLSTKKIINKKTVLQITSDARNILFYKNISIFFFLSNLFNIYLFIIILTLKLPTHIIFFYISAQLIIYLQNIFFRNSYHRIFNTLYSIPFNITKEKIYFFQNFWIKRIFLISFFLTFFLQYFLSDILNVTHRYFKIDYENFKIHTEILFNIILCFPAICFVKFFNIVYFYREERTSKFLFILQFSLIIIYILLLFFKIIELQNIFSFFIFINYSMLAIYLLLLLKEKSHKF